MLGTIRKQLLLIKQSVQRSKRYILPPTRTITISKKTFPQTSHTLDYDPHTVLTMQFALFLPGSWTFSAELSWPRYLGHFPVLPLSISMNLDELCLNSQYGIHIQLADVCRWISLLGLREQWRAALRRKHGRAPLDDTVLYSVLVVSQKRLMSI